MFFVVVVLQANIHCNCATVVNIDLFLIFPPCLELNILH